MQQALNPWSRTRSAATDGSPACCTSSLMLRVCVMLRVLPSVLLLYKQRCLSCLGHDRALQRRSASDKCSVSCRPIKQRAKFTATFDQNIPSMKYIFAFFSKIYRKYCLRDHFWRSEFLATYLCKHTNDNQKQVHTYWYRFVQIYAKTGLPCA